MNELRKELDVNEEKHASSIGTSTRENEDSRVEVHVKELLQEIEPVMKRYVDGHPVFSTWTVDDMTLELDSKTRSHVNSLKLPRVQGKPNLLLHELGSFVCASDAQSRRLRERLGNIFMPNHHTFLVNTSGSGKTRLLLEGLCANWGFYFTSMVDSSLLGSCDVQNSIQDYVPNAPKFRARLPASDASSFYDALGNNREIANRIFRQTFLARLIVCKLFAELMIKNRTADTHSGLYKTRWLLIQLQPRLLHPGGLDIFEKISCKLSKASDSYINTETKALLKRIRELCACFSTTDEATVEQTSLFCVLDEAQHAAAQHKKSFRSEQDGSCRPILREIVRAWDGQSVGQGVFMVVAGTGISKDVVDQAMTSAIMKDSIYRWCSDTGAFDDVGVQQRYLSKYLPRDFLESESGKRLLERIWYWLHGRYRFTANYIVELVQNGFRQPHRLLNAYVRHFSDFCIMDAHEFVMAESTDALPDLSLTKVDLSKLKKKKQLDTIHRVIHQYFMRSVIPRLGTDEKAFVQYGIARFVDSMARSPTIDEPLLLLSAVQWMNAEYRKSYQRIAHEISSDKSGVAFENYVAFCLDLAFSQKCRLNEVFKFCTFQPEWANMEARVVTLYRITPVGEVERGATSFYMAAGCSASLGTTATSQERLIQWLDHSLRSPFCFPDRYMGPDILFILELSSGKLIWVAVQTKWCEQARLPKNVTESAMKTVTPSQFYLHKNGNPEDIQAEIHGLLSNLPDRQERDAGTYSLLRVVASFPAEASLEQYTDPDAEGGHHPIATLNMDLVEHLTRELTPQNILEELERGLRSSNRQKSQERWEKEKQELSKGRGEEQKQQELEEKGVKRKRQRSKEKEMSPDDGVEECKPEMRPARKRRRVRGRRRFVKNLKTHAERDTVTARVSEGVNLEMRDVEPKRGDVQIICSIHDPNDSEF